EGTSQLAVCRNSAGDQNGACAALIHCGESAPDEVVDDGALKACYQIESGRTRKGAQCVRSALSARERLPPRFDFGFELRVAPQGIEHRGFDSAKAEVVNVAAHFRLAEADGVRISVGREAVNDRAAGIAERKHPGDFVAG